ncbi:MAG TPA: AMP-binding protein [Actinomycetota bacterium]|nr:AMP-binding protein [Actinomycetota bacterium]
MDEMPIGQALDRLAAEAPDMPAITCGPRTVTRAELASRTNRLARAYERLGVRTDDYVAIALPNSISFFEAAVAAWKLGAIPQPISSRLPRAEREAILDLAEPALVVGLPDGTHTGPTLPPGHEPDPSLPDDPLPERVGRSWKAPTSGGSTGRPKIIESGAPGLTQPIVCAVFGIVPDGTQLVAGPLYHNAPFMFSSLGLFSGNHLVVMERFDAAGWLDLAERHRADWAWMVPTMMGRISRLPDHARYDVSALQRVWHGAAPCPPWVKEAWITWLGPDRVWELYAGTEAQGVTIISGTEWLVHRGSVGRPIVGDISVRGPDGDELPAGEVGEVFMRGPDPSRPTYRYVGADPVERDGWETIGDMGWLDEDGYLYLADRRTDLILRGGANVYPAEVEAALGEHPRVAGAAVIGLPDPDLGQRVHAIVQTEGEVGDDELRSFLAERLVSYKIPETFERTAEPLRDDAGKIRRAALRDARLPELPPEG